jgi:hypothetical protein
MDSMLAEACPLLLLEGKRPKKNSGLPKCDVAASGRYRPAFLDSERED